MNKTENHSSNGTIAKKSYKSENEKRTLHEKHVFHATPNIDEVNKRTYLLAPDENSFEDEEGEFPMEDQQHEDEREESQNDDPLDATDEDNDRSKF